VTLRGLDEPLRLKAQLVSSEFFPLLGVTPLLGRTISADDDRPKAPRVAVISHALWQSRFGGERSVIGRNVQVNGQPTAIVGVMPDSFRFIYQDNDLWGAFQLDRNHPWREKDGRFIKVVGRLHTGVTLAAANTEMRMIARRLSDTHAFNKDTSVDLVPLRKELTGQVHTSLLVLYGAVGVLLSIACFNVANLLLARAAGRRREISVRAALGAGRMRIVRQLLTESLVLGLISVPLGVALAAFGTRLIAWSVPPDQVPYYVQWALDWRSVAYTVFVAATTALVFGLFPALQVSRGNLHETLKEGTRGNSVARSWLRSSLVVLQVAFALVSLVGALLFVRTFTNLGGMSLGFDPAPLMSMRFYLSGDVYEAEDAKLRRVEDIVRRVEALPGVRSAYASNHVPLSGGGGGGPVVVDGRPVLKGEHAEISLIAVTPHLNATLGITKTRGRDFTDAEGWSHSPVAIVNQTMAKRFWPDGDALDGRFRLPEDPKGEWFTVIGVTPDINLYGVDPSSEEPAAVAYVPYAYQQALNTGITIRVEGDPASITSAVRAELRAADPNLPMSQARTISEARRLSYWQFGLYGWIFGTIGVMGLLLAAIGVYGVLSYSVSQRTQEIGVRVALGAARRDILALVVGHGLLLAGIGIAIGLALSAGAMPFARSLLYNVSPFDPLTFTAVAMFLFAVAFLASYLPALRATRVDPVVALRGE
jgi:putative ABC transport system permease protein